MERKNLLRYTGEPAKKQWENTEEYGKWSHAVPSSKASRVEGSRIRNDKAQQGLQANCETCDGW